MGRTDRIYHGHTSVLCAIRLFTVSSIKQDIFEHILERSRMPANFLAARSDFRDRTNSHDIRGYTTTPTRGEVTRHNRLSNTPCRMEVYKRLTPWLK
jgi:hypothetical protein